MINASELISVAESLPLEMKTELIDRLIKRLMHYGRKRPKGGSRNWKAVR